MDKMDTLMCVVDGNKNIQKLFSIHMGKAYGEEFIAEMEEFLKDDEVGKNGLSEWFVVPAVDFLTSIDEKTNLPFYKSYKQRLLQSDGKPRFENGLYHHDSYPVCDEDVAFAFIDFLNIIGIKLTVSSAENELEEEKFERIMGWSDESLDEDFDCSEWTPKNLGNGTLMVISVSEDGVFALHAFDAND